MTKAFGLEAIASRVEAITTSSKKLLVTKAFGLEAIASRLEAIASRVLVARSY